MKKVRIILEPLAATHRYDEYENYIESTYPSGEWWLDPDVDEELQFVFFMDDDDEARTWFDETAEDYGLEVRDVIENPISDEEWPRIKTRLED